MNVDRLGDVLKSRECKTLYYFHTDHFEPWSYTIDDDSALAVEHMAELARSSPFARKLSLFYSVFVPYRVRNGDTGTADGDAVPEDGIVFERRSAYQEKLAQEVIRPLVTEDDHEMHLHVHHEYWTRNTSNFDAEASQWVNAHSTDAMDARRLDLHFRLCRDTIARETGRPFDRWGFIHGNWALNASDPEICHVADEMAMIMRHGGFGDFSFPAGRQYCDPRLTAPFTCRPIAMPRAYDEAASDPRAIGIGTRAMALDRFFIWNCPIKSAQLSLDYYASHNRNLFKMPEVMLAQWLGHSFALNGGLFVKTHAHSMSTAYKLAEADSVIPHRYPYVVTLFELLLRVCDRAGVEFRPVTVNEVMTLLRAWDAGDVQTRLPAAPAKSPRAARPAFRPVERGVHVLKRPFQPDGGQAWLAVVPPELHGLTDRFRDEARSPLRLFEDGRSLGEGHFDHGDIRSNGGGRYSFWDTALWFSTSDGSDPNFNGRVYSIVLEPAAQPVPVEK